MILIPVAEAGESRAPIVALQHKNREHCENIAELTFAMAAAESYSAAAVGSSDGA